MTTMKLHLQGTVIVAKGKGKGSGGVPEPEHEEAAQTSDSEFVPPPPLPPPLPPPAGAGAGTQVDHVCGSGNAASQAGAQINTLGQHAGSSADPPYNIWHPSPGARSMSFSELDSDSSDDSTSFDPYDYEDRPRPEYIESQSPTEYAATMITSVADISDWEAIPNEEQNLDGIQIPGDSEAHAPPGPSAAAAPKSLNAPVHYPRPKRRPPMLWQLPGYVHMKVQLNDLNPIPPPPGSRPPLPPPAVQPPPRVKAPATAAVVVPQPTLHDVLYEC